MTDLTIALMPSGRRGQVPQGTTLLDAARLLGVELESICGGRQTCGKCQIVVEEGHFPKHNITSVADHLTPMGPVEAAYLAENNIVGRRLACACEVTGDLLINVPEESQARKQIIAKAATDRVIEIDPAVRQIYIEVEEATMESHGGDWERIQKAVADQWHLTASSKSPSPSGTTAKYCGLNPVIKKVLTVLRWTSVPPPSSPTSATCARAKSSPPKPP